MLVDVIENYFEPEKLTDKEKVLYRWIKKHMDARLNGKDYAPGCYPPGILLGCTWKPEVIRKVGEALGMESCLYGVHFLLGPNVNILRDPRNGRLFEGYSEDPYLVTKLAPEIVAAYRQRLENLLREYLAKEDIEESRIIQEVALFTDKVNYTEETVRLRSHFDQFRQIITAGEPVGRKLDFLIQEMNREINTVASKANSAGAAHFVVDVKSEIEKIREQIQNIE